MKKPEMEIIAGLIVDILKKPGEERVVEKAREKVSELCRAFPLSAEYDFYIPIWVCFISRF